MESFILTDTHKKAIEIFELAGFTITLGSKVFPDKTDTQGTKTFGIFKDGIKKHGVSSTALLSPKFAMKIIKDYHFGKGYEAGLLKKQNDFKKVLGIE